MKIRTMRVFFFVAAVLLQSCSGGGGNGGSSNVSGTWISAVRLMSSSDPANPAGTEFASTFTLSQTDNAVSGTFSTEAGLGGTVSGQVDADVFLFTLNELTEACPKTCRGEATVEDNDAGFSGTYVCTDECGFTVSAEFVAVRG